MNNLNSSIFNDIVVVSSYVKGPRWGRFDIALKDYCFEHDITITKLERDTSLLTETVRYEVKGKKSDIVRLSLDIKQMIRKFNE